MDNLTINYNLIEIYSSSNASNSISKPSPNQIIKPKPVPIKLINGQTIEIEKIDFEKVCQRCIGSKQTQTIY